MPNLPIPGAVDESTLGAKEGAVESATGGGAVEEHLLR